MLFFKKKKVEESSNFRTSNVNRHIYCEIIWNKRENRTIKLYGYNKYYNLDKILCYNNIFERESYHSTQPSSNIYIPRILFEIDWNFIFKDDLKLKSFNITFSNYMESIREYSVILEAINDKNKEVKDTFSSTSKVFVDPYELTDNISKFLKYAETYK